MAKVQIINGNFQDSNGNVLALGNLQLELSQDEQVSGVGQICAKRVVTVPLDANGNVSGTVLMWPNDQMVPTNSYYLVKGYNAQGQLVWGPNAQQILGASPFDLNTWIPNYLPNFFPATSTPTLQTNGVNNGSQLKLNLKNGSNVTIVDDGVGDVTVNAATPTTLSTAVLQHQAVVVGTNTAWSSTWQLFTSGSIFGNNPSASAPTATLPRMINQDTNVGATQPAYIQESTKEITLGILNSWIMKCRMLNFATVGPQFWTGVTDLAPSALNFATATPAANFVGFRLVTPETTWKCVCQTDATHQTIVDSGITADTNLHKFGVQPTISGTSINFYIDGVKVATIATNVPAASVPLLTMVYAYDTIGLPNITLSFASFYWDTLF